MPELGVMPMGIGSPARASRVRWLLESVLKVVAMEGLLLPTGSTLVSLVISSMPLIWRRILLLSPASEAILAMAKRWPTLAALELVGWDAADRAVDHQKWMICWRSDGACCGGRRPALADSPLFLLAEGRSFKFLPAMKPKGRQLCSSMESMAWCYGAFVGPSGLVPGVGRKFSVEEQNRTRSRFLSSVPGPFRKVQGLFSSSSFLLGLCCNMCFHVYPKFRARVCSKKKRVQNPTATTPPNA